MVLATNAERGHPIRTCVGCRRRAPQHELVRCVLAGDVVLVDRSAPGRGAWICGPACVDAARRRRGFDRAWRVAVSPHVIDTVFDTVFDAVSHTVRPAVETSNDHPAGRRLTDEHVVPTARHERLNTTAKG